MNVDIIANGLMCLCALAGFIYSIFRAFLPNKSIYFKMVGLALGCSFLARLSTIIEIIITADLPDLFQIDTFGYIGYAMFIFSANYGTFDRLIDDGSDNVKKYRMWAYSAPLFFILGAVIILISPAHLSRSIPCAIEVLFMGATSYYDFKDIIIPDHYAGILSSLKPFHILSLIMSMCHMNENIIWNYYVTAIPAWALSYIPMYIVMLTMMPVLERGMSRWRV